MEVRPNSYCPILTLRMFSNIKCFNEIYSMIDHDDQSALKTCSHIIIVVDKQK